jgi:hypothetical protein
VPGTTLAGRFHADSPVLSPPWQVTAVPEDSGTAEALRAVAHQIQAKDFIVSAPPNAAYASAYWRLPRFLGLDLCLISTVSEHELFLGPMMRLDHFPGLPACGTA